MYGMVKSELMKMRHTFSLKLVFFAPLVTLLLGYILSGSYVQLSAYNWWYTIILPVLVSMLSASMIVRERNTGMQNILCLPVSSSKIWLGKISALILLVFGANLLFMAGDNISRICSKHGSVSYERVDGMLAAGANFSVADSFGDAAHQLDGIFSGSDSICWSEPAAFNDRRRKKLVLSGPVCNSGAGGLPVFWNAPQWPPVRRWFLFAGWGRCCSGRSDWLALAGFDSLDRLPFFWERCAEI